MAKKAAVKKPKAQQPVAKKTVKAELPAAAARQTPADSLPDAGGASPVSTVLLQKMTDSLRKMGDKRAWQAGIVAARPQALARNGGIG